MELQKVMEEFEGHLASLGRRESTRLAYRTDLGDVYRTLRQHLGREPLAKDLTPDFIRTYLEAQAKKQRRSTLLRRIASLRAFERYLREKGMISQPFIPEPSILRQLLDQTATGRATPCLTSEHLYTLWKLLIESNTRRGWRDLALVALLTEWGFPTERLIHLDLNDVDMEQKRIRIRSQGGVEMWFPIDYAVGPLQFYLEHVRYQYHLPPGETHLFVSQLGRPLSRQSVWQSLGAWGRTAGFEFPLTPRVLRSTAAYRLWRLGTPRELIQQALGHTNPISTLFLLRRLQQTCGRMPTPRLPRFDPETQTLVAEG